MNDFILSLMLMGVLSSSPGSLPFWMTTNQFGLMPDTSGAMALLRAGASYDEAKPLQWHWGAGLAANTDKKLLLDECYGGIRWKVLSLDLGMKRCGLDFMAADPTLGSLSVTGGHLVESGNARTMPGYSLNLEPLAIPFTKEHLWIYGNWGDYRTIDKRFVQDAWVHRMKAYLMLSFGNFEFHLGLDHFAQWNGVSPIYGQMPNTFRDYLRVVTGSSASPSGTQSDQMNVLGNQGGAELLKIAWTGNGWKLSAQHEIPYEDRSGMKFFNFPDGVNTIHFGFDCKDRWVSDIVYEFHYTMYQSGPIHDAEVDEEGKPIPWRPGLNFTGGDNYFNNTEYASGWTHFGRPTGEPLFYPTGTKDCSWGPSEIVLGVENNRIKAHHLGLSGKLFRTHPYRLMLTWSRNYGTYFFPYKGESQWGKPWGTVNETPLHQFSAGLNGEIVNPFKLNGLNLIYGLYADCGEVLRNCWGASLGLGWKIRHY